MTTTPGNCPAHGKSVCGESLSAMQKPFDLYPTQSVVGMMHMTARASERRAGGNAVCIGKTLWSVRRGRLACIVSAACRYGGEPREAGSAFLYCCICISEPRASFERAPAGGFLVRCPQVSIVGKQGHLVKAREAARQGMALTGCTLPAPMRVRRTGSRGRNGNHFSSVSAVSFSRSAAISAALHAVVRGPSLTGFG